MNLTRLFRPRAAAQRSRADRPLATPPIPSDIRGFRYQPHYTSIFEIYPDETHLYGTEDLYGDWGGEVLLLAKDAGASSNFLPASRGGSGWAWVHNPARRTNRNLVPLAEQLPCGKLYASILACLLRNDDQESGPIFLDDRVRAFVKRVLLWTLEQMPRVRSVAVLGGDSWRESMRALDLRQEGREWKARHLSGEPVEVRVAGKRIEFFALNHPARITADRLMQQPGWRRLARKHGATMGGPGSA